MMFGRKMGKETEKDVTVVENVRVNAFFSV